MDDDFVTLYAYSRWADGKMFEACRQLTTEQYAAAPPAGGKSVRATIVHIAVGTEGWLRGLTGVAFEKGLTEAELPTLDDAWQHLLKGYEHVDRVLPTLDAAALKRPMTFRGRGQAVDMPPWVVLRHVANHLTYHRGQVSTKLKSFGIQQPDTDLIFYVFEQMARSGGAWGTLR